MAPKKLSAKTLSYLLLAGLFLLAVGSAAGFYYTQNILREYAKSTSELTSKAAAGSENVTALTKIREYLASHQAEAEKVKKVVAESQSYNYRDEAVRELSRFARESGVKIVSINFSGGESGQGNSSGTTAQPQATAPSSSATPAPAASGGTTAPAATALKSSTFNVTIKNPVDYEDLLSFISRIEQNVTKMQISEISLTAGTEANDVSSESFNIEVYLR